MKAIFLCLLLLHGRLLLAEERSGSDESWLREGLAQQQRRFKRISLSAHPAAKSIVAANCAEEPSWWSELRVFHHTGDKVDWIATLPAAYRENCGHYLISCEWRYLKKLNIHLLEVFDSTHMGNGSLWLFTLQEHDLHLVLSTAARGRFVGPTAGLPRPKFGRYRLAEEHLKVEYKVLPGDKAESIHLTGTVLALDQEDRETARKRYAETWRWDVDRGLFVLDRR